MSLARDNWIARKYAAFSPTMSKLVASLAFGEVAVMICTSDLVADEFNGLDIPSYSQFMWVRGSGCQP